MTKTDEYLQEISDRVQECFGDPEKGVKGLEEIIAELQEEGLLNEAKKVQEKMDEWITNANAAYEAQREDGIV